VLGLSTTARAQQPAAVPLRQLLEDTDALTTWIATHSHDALAAEARVEQAQAVYGASRLRPNPQLTASFGGVPAGATNPPGLGWDDTVNYGATVSQLFEIGKRQPRSTAARLRVSSERQSMAGTLLGSVADAREAIARVLYGKSRKAALTEELENAHQILDLQRVRLERGDLSGIDFDRLQLDTQMLEADLAQASADYTENLAGCASVLFAPCDPGDADLDVVTKQLQPADQVWPPDWEAALKDRPDLQALDIQQQASVQDVALALKRKVPDPTVSLGFTRDRFLISGDNPRTVALGVTVPLPTFDRGKQDAARASAEGRELNETAAGVAARARSEAESLRTRHASIAAALDALSHDALTRANSILTSTSDAVSQGELSTTDLLLARRARTDVTLRMMDLQLQLYLVQNAVRQVLGLDAPAVRRIQGVTWPTP
jgi:cobalt-zinc-cadmium efflux system outer membrane protein